MAIRTGLQLGDPGLREVAKKVNDPAAPEIRGWVEDLSDTLAYWRKTTGYGRGIAAPQIGTNLRVIFLRLPGEDPWPLVNPEITWRSVETVVAWDACLSFLSIFMQVERHREIKVALPEFAGGVARSSGWRRAESFGTFATRNRPSRRHPGRGPHR